MMTNMCHMNNDHDDKSLSLFFLRLSGSLHVQNCEMRLRHCGSFVFCGLKRQGSSRDANKTQGLSLFLACGKIGYCLCLDQRSRQWTYGHKHEIDIKLT